MILRVAAPSHIDGEPLGTYISGVIYVYENSKLSGEPLIEAIWVNSFGANAHILLEELQKRYGTKVVRYCDR